MTAPKKGPRSDHKQFCAGIAPKGWAYTGFDDGFYCFQSGNYSDGFKEMLCIECDLTPENLALMAKMGVTRCKQAMKRAGIRA